MACEASRALPAPRPASPALPDSEKMQTAVTADDYLAHRRVLSASIDELQRLVSSLDSFHAHNWSIRYPQPTSGLDAASVPGRRDLSVLSLLDIKAGETLPALIPSLSLSTLAQLLSRRFATALQHLDALRVRVQDTDSKVLVTGDLNAGKSTFVNALMRREVMPVDQQPCTSVFTELVDASLNNGQEEAHAIKAADLAKYKIDDESTFTRFPMHQLDDACIDGHEQGFTLVRVYTQHLDTTEHSFVHNGIVDISLIDAPGLNRDTLSTTALFSRQSEIDVVVFLVNAENHFTLSAKEFLCNAARDKAYVFVVVNKFDGIRDKARCVKRVGEQLQQLSPATWASRAELVHFVQASHPTDQPAWTELETSLREFVLQKRSLSKLLPAKTYLLNLLNDLDVLADANVSAAEAQLQKAMADLEVLRPAHERLVKARDAVADQLHHTEESQVDDVQTTTRNMLDRALSFIAQGQLPPPSSSTASALHPAVKPYATPHHLPSYPGIMSIWTWAEDLKSTLLQSLEGSLRDAEEYARNSTIQGVQHITGHLADTFLPQQTDTNTEQRVFRPEVMYAKHRKARLIHRGIASVGLNTPSSPSAQTLSTSKSADIEISVLDLFDVERLWPHFSATANDDAKTVDDPDVAGALSVSTIGVGALTMFGSRAVGVQGFVQTLARITELAGSQTARKWAGPVVGVLTIGLAVYIVIDVPRAVTLNIGRKIQASLEQPASLSQLQRTFSEVEADRISKESRKVLRLASWELREQFRKAFEASTQHCADAQHSQNTSQHALHWLQTLVQDLEQQKSQLQRVDLDA